MSYYRDTLSAVVRCLSAETIDNTSKQAWQKLYDAGYPENRGGSGLNPQEQRDMDCLLHARLHRQLSALDWAVLVAKYSTHKARKVDAIGFIIPRIESPAPRLFVSKAVTAWAIPKLPGKAVSNGQELASRAARQEAQSKALSKWAQEALVDGNKDAELEEVKRDEYVKRSTDMIVLDARFYDMNSWDPDARPEQTRRRWRGGIGKRCEELVTQALRRAEAILEEEGLLVHIAA
ncbi:hypothetical protein [uncultured Pseudomonas sp.]|uniref:hypothetical protein n=1 Tax=uncultured Pseudomonas sp. TaxID=114707 RepID=UPI002584C444|nr:hypothetical protein [uncultured Pseudomonas sp.]